MGMWEERNRLKLRLEGREEQGNDSEIRDTVERELYLLPSWSMMQSRVV